MWTILFLMWTILKVFIEFVTILLLFYVWFFDCKARGILPPQPGIEPISAALDGEVLTLDCWSRPYKVLSKHSNWIFVDYFQFHLLRLKCVIGNGILTF